MKHTYATAWLRIAAPLLATAGCGRALQSTPTTGGSAMMHETTDTTSPLSARRDAARTFLSTARTAHAEGDFGKAYTDARAGIEALGDDYNLPLAADDTALKIAAAEERFDEGHVKDAASVMMRMLEERIALSEAPAAHP